MECGGQRKADKVNDENPVFSSTRQALHVSFLMEVMPATAKSQMQAILEQLMAEAGIVQELDLHERTVDFGGLTALEVRGQCALVVGAVNSHLTAPERAAVWTRYGVRRRQAEGVRALGDYVAPMLTTRNEWAIMAMIWGQFSRTGKRDEDFSLRKIEAEFKVPKSTLQRDQQSIVRTEKQLGLRAMQRLQPYFKRTNLVPEDETLQTS